MSTPSTNLTGKRVAIYARFSSDKQNPSSAEDQVLRCQSFVAGRGGSVSEKNCFKDEGISGASLLRPEFERLMSLVHARLVDVVVVEDPDRLSRDMEDSARLFKDLNFFNVELISASDGMSSFAPAAKTHFFLKGFMGEAFLDNLRDKTLRGQTARFNAGFATGAVAFGYQTKPKTNELGEVVAHTIAIDDAQAQIVRRVFREYLNGRSLSLIASGLNADGVPPPRSKKRTGAAAWGDSTIRGMLHNEAYAGVWKFARRKWTKVPGTNVRRPKPRTANDMPLAQDRPHLRIVDEKTWTEVQARLAAVHLHYTRQSEAKSSISSKANQYLFSGILVCDHCGSLMFVYGRGTGRRYRCTGNAKRGICSNRVTVLESVARTCLLNGIRKTLTNDWGLAYARKVAALQNGEHARQVEKDLKAKTTELTKTEARIKVLIEQMADGDAAAYVREALNEFASKAKVLKAELANLQAAGTEPVKLPAPEVIHGWVNDLQAFVDRDPLGGREYLRKLLKNRQVRLQAQPDGIYKAKTELLPMVLLTETPPQVEPEGAFSSRHCGGRI